MGEVGTTTKVARQKSLRITIFYFINFLYFHLRNRGGSHNRGHITIHLALLEYEAPVYLMIGKTPRPWLKMYMGAAIRELRSVTAKDTCDPTHLTLSPFLCWRLPRHQVDEKVQHWCCMGQLSRCHSRCHSCPGAAAKARSGDRGERVSALSSPHKQPTSFRGPEFSSDSIFLNQNFKTASFLARLSVFKKILQLCFLFPSLILILSSHLQPLT